MKTLRSHRSTEIPTFDLGPTAASTPGLVRLARILAQCGAGLLAVLVALILVRLGLAFYLHGPIADNAAEISRVSGLDLRVALWLENIVSWTASFALVNLACRAVGRALWPISFGPWRWQPTAAMLAVSGFGVLLPSAIQSLRGVDPSGRPAQMIEIVAPAGQSWFAPDGLALIAFSREPDGRLRFWNRDGLTPDRALSAKPVTGEIRSEWERVEAARAAVEKATEDARKATQRREQEKRETALRQAAAQRAAQHAAEAKKQKATDRQRQADEEKAATARQLAALRRDLDTERAARDRQLSAVPAVPGHPANLRNDGVMQLGFRLQEPSAPARVPAPAPTVRAPRPYGLRPGSTLNIRMHRHPCEVWSDVAFVIYPDHPSLPHAVVPAGRVFRFPRLHGVGPTTLHARPTGSGGTLWMRPTH